MAGRHGSAAELQEFVQGLQDEFVEAIAGGAEDGAVVAPNENARAHEKEAVETSDQGCDRSRATRCEARKHRGLKLQMAGFVLEDAVADGGEQGGVGGGAEGAIVGNGDDFGGYEHAEREFEAGEDAEAAENRVDPVLGEAGEALGVHETGQDAAVALFLVYEEREGLGKMRVADFAGEFSASLLEAAALGAFAKLELGDRRGGDAALGGGEYVRIVPG
jgi:hypothetical protein